MHVSPLLLLLLLPPLLLLAVADAADQCGYEACDTGKPGFTNIHLVPHTHDDVGWLKTVDQYFYGARNDIQNAGVQYIIDSVVDTLRNDPRRKFTYVEMAFFYRWWREQNDDIKQAVRDLVKRGQLMFTVGGWCMADEASTHYSSLIDAHTLGLRLLQAEFGDCGRPRVAWQVDPFGHSREFANLHSQLGFDATFFGRIDYQDFSDRLLNHQMEMLWNVSNVAGDPAAELFTGVLYRGYNPPGGFYWELGTGDPYIQDDKLLDEYNVDERVDFFLNVVVKDQAPKYSTSHNMMTMGTDFQFQDALTWFRSMDKLIEHVNARIANGSRVYAFYSTPACYAYAINRERANGWSVKTDDFFPYAHAPHAFWTGYFTSRAALKGYERAADRFLQTASQLNALAGTGLDKLGDQQLFILRDALGIVQHHDAVSGTEKQHVAYDYARKVARGAERAQEVVRSAYAKLMPASASAGAAAPTQYFCWLLNESICNFATDPKNAEQFSITVYNPLSRTRNEWLRVPVLYNSYEVSDSQGKPVVSQNVPVSDITRNIWRTNGYGPDLTAADFERVFLAENIPPFGYTTFFLKHVKLTRRASESKLHRVKLGARGSLSIENENIALAFDTLSGQLTSLTQKQLGVSLPFGQSLRYYEASAASGQQASGAYIFRPVANTSNALPLTSFSYIVGPLVSEVYQSFGGWAAQVIRLYKNDLHFELEWTVGPIDVSDNKGREVISLYQTPLDNQQSFYTDSNGRQMLLRKLDYRPTWKFAQTEPVAGNYFPVNSRIFIQDQKQNLQLTVLTDRSEGGSSIVAGSIELMLHRRLLADDGLGVGEALSEPGISGKGLVVRGSHYVLLNTIDKSAALHRDYGIKAFLRALPTFAAPRSGDAFLMTVFQRELRDYWSQSLNLKPRSSELFGDLPPNVQISTLQEWDNGTLLLRLEHLFQPYEDPKLAQNVTLDLSNIFKNFKVDSFDEMSLGGNMLKSDWVQNRLRWNAGAPKQQPKRDLLFKANGKWKTRASDFKIVLQPAELRTFKLHVQYS